MPSRVILNEKGREGLILLINAQKMPFSVSITKGKNRSNEQNKLQRKWCNEIAEQLGDKAERIRGMCKLEIGVPIMRAANEVFAEKYDRLIKPLPYEQKLELMMEPMDFPVTSLMTTKQKAEYLDAMWHKFTAEGVILTNPQDRGRG